MQNADWKKLELPRGLSILSGMVVEYKPKFGGFPTTLRAATNDEFLLMCVRDMVKREGANRLKSCINYVIKHPLPPK